MEPIIPAGVKRTREDGEDATQQPPNSDTPAPSAPSTTTETHPPVAASNPSQSTNPSESTSAAPTPATQKATPTTRPQPLSNASPAASQPGKAVPPQPALARKSLTQRPPGLLGLRHSNSSGNLASSPNATGPRSFTSSINSVRSPLTPGAPHSPTFSAPGDVKTKLVQLLVSCFVEDGEPATESETVCRQVVEQCRGDRDVVRTLHVFLKDPKNGVLRKRVLSGEIPPAQLIRMKEKELMAPDDLKKFEEEAQMRLRDRDMQQLAAAKKTSSTLFKCKKCKKNDTNFYEMQTRSADEPMTIFIQCNNCGNRWKE